ncbi:MAG: hypothetical protein SOZ80_03480 [Prevotella sp.]|nr:hypothetical protein [Prevotella sp.]MDD7317220.1 hypothetical protein [Prevotellaceae bacterium]MDY4019824.1 hypothetical protein [Prevotella sp.]
MSQKRKKQRAARSAMQEKQAQTVVRWIFGIFVLIAVLTLLYVAFM